jgi:hypothetical protein
LAARDGAIGHVRDFFFDEQSWVIRHLVVDTGSWKKGRLVLVSPQDLVGFDGDGRTLHVRLGRQQIEDGPSIESHRPISRHYEADFYRYYGWPAYWNGGAARDRDGPPGGEFRDDRHLQSTHAINGFKIHTTDGAWGVVSGCMVDDQGWVIREVVVETGCWYAGKQVMIAPGEIDHMSCADAMVWVSPTRAALERSAEHRLVHAGLGAE